MPRNGMPRRMVSMRDTRKLRSFSTLMSASKCPTPGSNSARAFETHSGVVARCDSAPRRWSARSTEATLLTPQSKRVITASPWCWGAPVQNAQMNIGARGLRKSLKEVFGQLGLKITDARAGDFCVHHAKGPPAEIDGAGSECFVHRHQEITGTQNATFCAQRFGYSFA